ncbi:MAG: undecaprenyl-diphosphate phosphatase, partial [bacterium]|nr:undecaprenyl-diphosphate phosphatase [bacterium]
MLEYIALGALQGVAEWLPISSEAVVILATTHLFPTLLLSDAIRLALFLHLGTFLAALVYLRHDVRKLLRAVYHYTTANEIEKR